MNTENPSTIRAARPLIPVCAAVIVRNRAVLLAQRPAGTHLAGAWEFPGGKLHPGEAVETALRREIREELGVTVTGCRRVTSLRHDYPEKTVLLHFLTCVLPVAAEPQGLEGQAVAWFERKELAHLNLAPADRRFVRWVETRPETQKPW